MVGLVAVVLVIAGAGSLLLTRNAARTQAKQQLVSEANSLTAPNSTRSLTVLGVVAKTLKLENAEIIRINPLGTVVTPLPKGLTQQDLNVPALQSGETVSGQTGNVVYAVAPVKLTASETRRLQRRRGFPGRCRA